MTPARTLTPRIALMLTVAPLFWAANAVVGKLAVGLIPPVAMNFGRWVLALLLLLPWVWRLWQQGRDIWARWPYLSGLGLLGMGCYNALQYLALHSSSPLNVTLIAASAPFWMLALGAVAYGKRPRCWDIVGACLSLAGVVLVISRGDLSQLLGLTFVEGDLLMLIAIITWCVYSWQLAHPPASMTSPQRPSWNWAEFLAVQIFFGLGWCALSAGLEYSFSDTQWTWSLPVVGIMLFVALGPSLLAYRSWGLGVAAVGPSMAGFFGNLTPIFAALFSAALLGQWPQWYHGLAFTLIVAGIGASAYQARTPQSGK